MSKKADCARRSSRKAWLMLLALGVIGSGLLWHWAETTAYAATFVVNTAADSDDGVCSAAASGCTLREAINAANSSPGPDIINFNIPGSGTHTIQLNTNLPGVNGQVTINGYSQPGASPNTLNQGNNASLRIELVGGYTEGACCQETGLRLAGTENHVRGLVINSFLGTAIAIQSSDSTVQGNFIGTDETGTDARGNNIGVAVNDTQDVLIGGGQPADRNVISGNRQDGIQAGEGEAPLSAEIRNNYIGTASNGVSPLGNGRGVFLVQATRYDIASNVIAYNTRQGILLNQMGAGNSFVANSIHSNGGLGIDLGGDGVTPNDAGDADAGPNNLQNFPVITSATASGVTKNFQVTLNSTPNTTFALDLYASPSCDPSGHGEGQEFVISSSLTTNTSGTASISITLGGGFPEGPFFTMTATNASNTSEFSPCAAALAGTFVVNTTADTDDGLCNAANCTLREAINAANGNPTANAINFNIPGAGVQTIAPSSPLPPITAPVIIDGYTQLGASPNTLAEGSNAVLLIELNGAGAGSTSGLDLQGGSSVVRGLVINRFASSSGIRLTSSGGNVVAGNFIGTNPSGASKLSNDIGISINTPGNRVGGHSPGERNVISGNSRAGVTIVTTSAKANVVEGNFIGTAAAGSATLGNAEDGVFIIDASDNVIGGGSTSARNLISGNGRNGVRFIGGSDRNHVLGNFIGTDVTGAIALSNMEAGVFSGGGDARNLIGGHFSSEGNVIAFNGGDGVSLGTGNGNHIIFNSIHSNQGLGINLRGGTEDSFGVTVNDPNDADTGPNSLQNFPMLQSASTSGSVTTVSGILNSTPNTILRVLYYSSPSCDPAGHGEGHKPIAEVYRSTGAGTTFFSTDLTNASFSGRFITATATDPAGNTSEFSPCVEAPPASTFQFGQSIYSITEDCAEVIVSVSRIGDVSGAATVDYATQNGTASERSDFTTARGTLRFTAGETAISFVVLITEDSRTEGTETATVTLNNPTGAAGIGMPGTATIEILDDTTEPGVNTIDVSEQLACQHYADFLNRHPDAAGLNFWTNQIEQCGFNQSCIAAMRINVSAAFFLSIEFQETGFFAIRVQRAAFGKKSDTASSRISYTQFIKDSRHLGEGVVVLTPGWEQKLEENRQAYAEQLVASNEFVTKYPLAQTAEQFVDALFTSAMVTPTTAERQEAIAAFGAGGTAGRVAALRKVSDTQTLRTAEFRAAFVLMQYFGYLRRDPDDPGYQFWLGKLNQFNGDFVQAEMVRAFISSIEYRDRFGPP